MRIDSRRSSSAPAELNALLGRDPAIAETATRLQTITQNVQEHSTHRFPGREEKSERRTSASDCENEQAATPAAGSCDNIDLEAAKFTVRSVQIDDPFKFLPWVKARQRRAENQIVALVQGKPFTYKDAGAKAIEIIERENFLPDTSDQRVKIRVEIAGVRNCTGGQVDLIYRIYSTQILPS